MRLQLFAFLALATQNINGASLPEFDNALSLRESADILPRAAEVVSPDHSLERRKGGGGRGGGSSGGSSSSGGGRSSGSSYSGGSTRAGSGPSRSYGRGGYYGGGAAVPYQAGSRTPKGLVAGAIIAPVAILAIMPGIWLYSVYPYYYNNPYRFYNRSGNATNNNGQPTKRQNSQQGANETLPVICLCQEFSVCGCDENTDQSYLDSIIGDGSYASLNKSLVTVSQVNNTKHLVLNGSLPNGTTAPGGVDDAASALAIGKSAGYWFAGLLVLYGIML